MKFVVVFCNLLFFIGCNSQSRLSENQKNQLQQIKQNFVFVEGGTFEMGKDGVPEANPRHSVTLDSYSICKFETTFNNYDLYTLINGLDSVIPDARGSKEMGDNFGVSFVTWYQARSYCQWLGKQLSLNIDLPSEAQWEYGARSRGVDVQHATNNGDIKSTLGAVDANYGFDEVGSYPPNPLGIYDMSGGKPEWVRDWYFRYKEEPRTNPVQDSIQYSKSKIVRGWHTLSNSVYGRGKRKPDFDKDKVGFRCVCNQKTPIE